MRHKPLTSRGRVITGYASAVAVAAAVFCGGVVLDDRLHPATRSNGLPAGVIGAAFTLASVFLLVLAAALVPVMVGLAAFRSARVTQPAWFAAYGVATGLLLANLFRDPTTGLALPGLAGAVGGLTLRAIMGPPVEPASAVEAPAGASTAEIQDVRRRLSDRAAQTAHLSDALASNDPVRVALALEEIAAARRIQVALGADPTLGEVLRAMAALGFVARCEAGGTLGRDGAALGGLAGPHAR